MNNRQQSKPVATTPSRVGLKISALVISLVLVGCSSKPVLQSTYIPEEQLDSKESREGLVYFLPKRLVRLTAKRVVLPPDAKAKRDAAKKNKAALEEKRNEVIAEIVKLENQKSTLKDQDANAAIIATIDKQLVALKKTHSNLNGQIEEAAEKISKLHCSGDSSSEKCTQRIKNSVELVLEGPTPDEDRSYVARIDDGSWFKSVNLNVSTTPEGLLSTARTEVTEQQGEVLAQLGRLAGFIAGVPSAGSAKFMPESDKDTRRLSGCDKPWDDIRKKPYTLSMVFDPTEDDELEKVNCELFRTYFPFAVSKSEMGPEFFDESDSEDGQEDEASALNSLNTQNGLTQRVDSIKSEVNDIEGNVDALSDRVTTLEQGDAKGRNRSGKNGLFYARPVPEKLFVLERDINDDTNGDINDAVWHVSESMVLMLPNKGPKGLIPFESRGFVRTVNDVTFENGMLTRWETDQPSVALAVVRVPVDVVGAFFGAIAELVQLKVDISSKEQALAETQASQIEADAKLLALKLCIEASGNSREELMECFAD